MRAHDHKQHTLDAAEENEASFGLRVRSPDRQMPDLRDIPEFWFLFLVWPFGHAVVPIRHK